jgi:hypothetical protein
MEQNEYSWSSDCVMGIREQSKLRFVAKEIDIKSLNHRIVECIITAIQMLVVEFTSLIVI